MAQGYGHSIRSFEHGGFGYEWTFDNLLFHLSFYLRLGKISAPLAAMNKTVEYHDQIAEREMIKAKQE